MRAVWLCCSTMHSVPAAPGSDRPIMKLAPGAPLGGGWGRCLLLQDIGVTRQAFQYDPRAQLSPASQPAVAVTQPLHAISTRGVAKVIFLSITQNGRRMCAWLEEVQHGHHRSGEVYEPSNWQARL
jgi:hypothetical protein